MPYGRWVCWFPPSEFFTSHPPSLPAVARQRACVNTLSLSQLGERGAPGSWALDGRQGEFKAIPRPGFNASHGQGLGPPAAVGNANSITAPMKYFNKFSALLTKSTPDVFTL